MNVFDSHVEALAFNYLNFAALTILNNLWTWLALLTAALSFWRIRSSGHPAPKHDNPTRLEPDPVAAEPLSESETPRRKITADVDGVTKGKFTAVYYSDVQCGSDGESEEVLTAFDGEGCDDETAEWWKCWETVLRVRNGVSEKGWYTCQDLTELNGNVVRLWDGGSSFTSLNRNSMMMIRC